MALDVKICGLKTVDAIEAVIAGGATHCGLIFFKKSPRHVDLAHAMALRKIIGNRAKTVAVTVDADDIYLDEIAGAIKPDLLQLHGGESPDHVQKVKSRYGLPVMKAIAIRETSDLAAVTPYREVADRLLFDAKPPKDSEVPGGHGVAFDWSVLDSLDPDIEYMLSGGLNASNIAEALGATAPTGIDISSGVENAPGIKDTALIAAFFDALASTQRCRV